MQALLRGGGCETEAKKCFHRNRLAGCHRLNTKVCSECKLLGGGAARTRQNAQLRAAEPHKANQALPKLSQSNKCSSFPHARSTTPGRSRPSLPRLTPCQRKRDFQKQWQSTFAPRLCRSQKPGCTCGGNSGAAEPLKTGKQEVCCRAAEPLKKAVTITASSARRLSSRAPPLAAAAWPRLAA